MSAGICPFIKPNLCAFFTISQGNSPVRSSRAATGMISSFVNLLESACISNCSSDKLKQGPLEMAFEKDRILNFR